MSLALSQSYVYYYIREGLWRTQIHYCKESYDRYNDPFFLFWRAFAIFKEGNPSQAINEIQPIQSKPELSFATIKASIYYHNQCRKVDRKTVDSLTLLERDVKRSAGDRAIVAATYFSMFTDDVEGATDMVSNCRFDSPNISCVKGWLEVMKSAGEKSAIDNAQTYFEEALSQDECYLEAFFGLARVGEIAKKSTLTQNSVNEILLNHPSYVPGLLDKCRMCLSLQDFTQLYEVVNETLREERNNLIAYKYWAVYAMVSEGAHDVTLEKYERLSELITQNEPSNVNFMLGTAKIMSRICGRSNTIINISIKMLEKCRSIASADVEILTELAYNYLMINEIDKAYALYKDAAGIDFSRSEPTIGMIRTLISKGDLDEAESQLMFQDEICSGMGGKTPESAYLDGVIKNRRAGKKDSFKDKEEKLKGANKALDEALKMHIMASKNVPYSFEFYVKLNPDFLLSLAQEFLFHSDFSLAQIKEKIQNPTNPTHLVGKAAKLLDTVVKRVYGLIPGYMLASRAKLINGNINGAKISLEKALQFDPKNEEAHILNAIIVYSNGNLEAATNSIKEALANNFEIINNPFFMCIKGQIELEKGDYEEGLKTMIKTYQLPGVQDFEDYKRGVKNKYMTVIEFSENVRSQIFIMTAKAYALNKNYTESKKIMGEAIMEFSGTEEEATIFLGNADLHILQNDLKKALSILKAVEPTNKGYMAARKKLAEIYLNNLCQRRQYAKCFYDLCVAFPTFENYMAYGDALMTIQEPEEAKLAYEEANNQDQDNEQIVRKIGKAMACTHNYQEAIRYYENAIGINGKNIELQLDHSKLLVKLNHLDQATQFLNKNMFIDDFADKTLEIIKRNIDGLSIQAKLHKKRMVEGNEDIDGENFKEYLDCLQRGYGLQQEAIEHAKYEGGNVDDERKICSENAQVLAQVYQEFENNLEKAYEYYKEAFKYNSNNYDLIINMADIDLIDDKYDEAEEKARKVLNLSPGNPKALWILGQVLMAENEIEKGIAGFTKVYERDMTNFTALAMLFMFLRKNGQLNDIKERIKALEEKLGSTNEPGLCFCKGLYFFFRKNPQEALLNFQRAKRNKLYLDHSIMYMIDIYMNPDQDVYFSHLPELNKLKHFEDSNIESQERLLSKLPSRIQSEERDTFLTYQTMLKEKKYPDAEKVLTDIQEENPKFVPAQNSMCLLRMLRKGQGGKSVKDILRVISKCGYNPRWGEECERGWINVADYLISITKLSLAEKECQKILKHNASSVKAYEYCGIIHERNEKFDDAATAYMEAWAITEECDNAIGYRLACVYFKNKQYVQCINTSKKVLALNPTYPKIKTEIMNKARELLRP